MQRTGPANNGHPRRPPTLRAICLAAAAFCLATTTSSWTAAEPPATVATRVDAMVDNLNSDNFGVRNDALRRLQSLIADESQSEDVLRRLRGRLADPQLSLDVREALQRLVLIGPATKAAAEPPPAAQPPKPDQAATPEPVVAATELDGLLDALDAERFERRDAAARRLLVAARSAATCGPVLERLDRRAVELPKSIDVDRICRDVWRAAWGTWLADEKNAWHPPAPTDAELQQAVDGLAASTPVDPRTPWLSETSGVYRRVLLWIADATTSPAAVDALQRRLDSPVALSLEAKFRLETMRSWAMPAMAAEFWQNRRHVAVQHLVLGVPNMPEGAVNPSLFDRCDDEKAHCVSGNSLATGDHPVGIFFPHPKSLEAGTQFHLVNLPTARRRLAYEFEFPIIEEWGSEIDAISDRRRGPITRRTVDHFLEQKRLLTEAEIDMLKFLDLAEVSRFAGPYLQGVDDERYDDGSPQAFGNGSLHGRFCYQMTFVATPEAGRAVAAAVDRNRVLAPTEERPYRIDCVAALYLAAAAPWPEVDAWLATQLDRREPLNANRPDSADVGASAAALLLRRHDVEPTSFGLEHCQFDELNDLENPGYRFVHADDREQVKRWWRERPMDSPEAKLP